MISFAVVSDTSVKANKSRDDTTSWVLPAFPTFPEITVYSMMRGNLENRKVSPEMPRDEMLG